LKILFCAYDRPGQIASGPNAWLQRLVPDLISNHGLDIQTLFVYSGESKKCPTISFFKNNNLPLHLINSNTHNYVEDQVKALLNIVKREHITTVVANLVIPALYATQYLKPFNIPIIGVLHSNDQFHKGVITKFIHGKTKNQLSTAVSVSEYINTICESQNTNTQLLNIPCGTPEIENSTLRNSQEILKVIYAGRLVKEAKQVLKLTKAFCDASKINGNINFSIYGDGDKEQSIKALIKDEKATNNVTLFKALPPSQILNKIQEHHVFTLMSDYEGMPIALMEAMACGLVPVCYIGEGGIDEIIEHGVNGFIVKDRSEDYQKKLQLLANDRSLWETMSKNAIATIQQKYSSKITHQKWFELLNQFKDVKQKPLGIPLRIKLKGALLYYGDNRKPSLKDRSATWLKSNWMAFRIFIRPRARLRELLK
jgi:colanic acid/amylovoran biosynthesis glycosyltransferase